jgi:hypothetical protein
MVPIVEPNENYNNENKSSHLLNLWQSREKERH